MATRHRTPVAPGYRAWAAAVIVLQCERGGRPVTAVYGFWALFYSAFGAQDLSDEAATTSLLGALAAAFALAVRVIATMSMGEGRAAAAEVALHCLGCAGVAFAAWALVHDAAAPADAHGHGRLALALCAGAAPALLAARSGAHLPVPSVAVRRSLPFATHSRINARAGVCVARGNRRRAHLGARTRRRARELRRSGGRAAAARSRPSPSEAPPPEAAVTSRRARVLRGRRRGGVGPT